MPLSRKHYEAVAAILYASRFTNGNTDLYTTGRNDSIKAVVESLARYFASENENFDASRFINAAGQEYYLNLRDGSYGVRHAPDA